MKTAKIIKSAELARLPLPAIVRIVAAANGWELQRLAWEIDVAPSDLSRLGTTAERPLAARRIAAAIGAPVPG